MNITVNGTPKQYPSPIPLAELVGQFCKNPKHVIAEVNGEILRSSQWAGRSIAEGDTIELVGFVGGG